MTASPTDFARHLSGYFLRHLACEKGLSAHTVASRRTAFTLLIEFCGKREGIPVGKIAVATLDRDRIVRFLDWLESERGNCIATRNVRLDAIKTFFAYLMAVAPEHMLQCQQVGRGVGSDSDISHNGK
jgi:site-specific recombinase XerD